MVAHPICFKLGPNENCVKVMQVRKQGWGEEVHHIPHTRVNSCKEAGFSRVGGGGGVHNLRTGEIHAEG